MAVEENGKAEDLLLPKQPKKKEGEELIFGDETESERTQKKKDFDKEKLCEDEKS